MRACCKTDRELVLTHICVSRHRHFRLYETRRETQRTTPFVGLRRWTQKKQRKTKKIRPGEWFNTRLYSWISFLQLYLPRAWCTMLSAEMHKSRVGTTISNIRSTQQHIIDLHFQWFFFGCFSFLLRFFLGFFFYHYFTRCFYHYVWVSSACCFFNRRLPRRVMMCWKGSRRPADQASLGKCVIFTVKKSF